MMSIHCYCEDCRRSSGTGHGSHVAVAEEALSVEGKTTAYVKPSDSGAAVTRYFCPTCGSAVYSTNSGMPGVIFLRASSLDDLEVFKPQMHVFASRAASWDAPAPGSNVFETMPPRE